MGPGDATVDPVVALFGTSGAAVTVSLRTVGIVTGEMRSRSGEMASATREMSTRGGELYMVMPLFRRSSAMIVCGKRLTAAFDAAEQPRERVIGPIEGLAETLSRLIAMRDARMVRQAGLATRNMTRMGTRRPLPDPTSPEMATSRPMMARAGPVIPMRRPLVEGGGRLI